VEGGFNFGSAITKHDTTNITQPGTKVLTDAVYVGGAGVVAAVWADSSVSNFTAVAGQILPICIKRVNSTNTTATLLVGLWQV
jgi:hypothetical protein